MWIICVQSNKKLFLQASEELEDRQSLAVMAASGQDEVTGPDGETFIEKYTRGKWDTYTSMYFSFCLHFFLSCLFTIFLFTFFAGVSAVETILTLDRLRQSVAIKELINAKSKHLLPIGGQNNASNNNNPFMRKTVSVPNMSCVSIEITKMCKISMKKFRENSLKIYLVELCETSPQISNFKGIIFFIIFFWWIKLNTVSFSSSLSAKTFFCTKKCILTLCQNYFGYLLFGNK